MNIVILAGGSGTRLWPMSRSGRAKQFCSITDERTMLQLTIDRFVDQYGADKLFLSITPDHLEMVKKIVPDFKEENIIVEPELRDTAAAMGFVLCWLEQQAPDEPVAFVPSDHFINDTELFLKTLQLAEKKIKEKGYLMDIGMVPENPSTALGYMKIGKMTESEDGIEIYEFKEHKEKPDLETAKKFLKDGNYLWHGNYYMWTPRLFLTAFEKYAPEVYKPLEKMCELMKKELPKLTKGTAEKVAVKSVTESATESVADSAADPEGANGRAISLIEIMKTDLGEKIKKIYHKIPKIAIDYAVAEKLSPEKVRVIKGEFGWSDIGSWDILHEKMNEVADKKGNVTKGEWVGLDTANSLVYAPKDKLVATLGIDNLIVVETKDALLICEKGRAQELKGLIEKIRDEKKGKYL